MYMVRSLHFTWKKALLLVAICATACVCAFAPNTAHAADGSLTTQADINGHTYKSSSSGWVEFDSNWYYYDATQDKCKIGWYKDGVITYYLDPDNYGARAKGFKSIKSTQYYEPKAKLYYFKKTGTNVGALQGGWIKDGKKWYYADPSTGVINQSGWFYQNGTWYYLSKKTGAMHVGWLTVSGKKYYMKTSGAMVTGWQKIGGKWYYFDSSGALQKGWKKLSGTWYYLDPSSGVMKTGWQKISGTWYHMASSGAMDANKWIGDYYVEGSGAMATNKWIGPYYVGPDGKWVPGKKK